MNTFQHGQKVASIVWPDETRHNIENDNIKSMSISMETGHMANLAFVRIDYKDGTIGMEYTCNVFVLLAKGTE